MSSSVRLRKDCGRIRLESCRPEYGSSFAVSDELPANLLVLDSGSCEDVPEFGPRRFGVVSDLRSPAPVPLTDRRTSSRLKDSANRDFTGDVDCGWEAAASLRRSISALSIWKAVLRLFWTFWALSCRAFSAFLLSAILSLNDLGRVASVEAGDQMSGELCPSAVRASRDENELVGRGPALELGGRRRETSAAFLLMLNRALRGDSDSTAACNLFDGDSGTCTSFSTGRRSPASLSRMAFRRLTGRANAEPGRLDPSSSTSEPENAVFVLLCCNLFSFRRASMAASFSSSVSSSSSSSGSSSLPSCRSRLARSRTFGVVFERFRGELST